MPGGEDIVLPLTEGLLVLPFEEAVTVELGLLLGVPYWKSSQFLAATSRSFAFRCRARSPNDGSAGYHDVKTLQGKMKQHTLPAL